MRWRREGCRRCPTWRLIDASLSTTWARTAPTPHTRPVAENRGRDRRLSQPLPQTMKSLHENQVVPLRLKLFQDGHANPALSLSAGRRDAVCSLQLPLSTHRRRWRRARIDHARIRHGVPAAGQRIGEPGARAGGRSEAEMSRTERRRSLSQRREDARAPGRRPDDPSSAAAKIHSRAVRVD